MFKMIYFLIIFFSSLISLSAFASDFDEVVAAKCLGLQHLSMIKCVELERQKAMNLSNQKMVGDYEKSDTNPIVLKDDGTKADGDLDHGKVVFYQYCYVCHGLEGKGNGPAAEYSERAIADLTNPALGKVSDASLLDKLMKGSTPMAGFTDNVLSKNDLLDVIKYIKRFTIRGNSVKK